jgi:hypothetical protein
VTLQTAIPSDAERASIMLSLPCSSMKSLSRAEISQKRSQCLTTILNHNVTHQWAAIIQLYGWWNHWILAIPADHAGIHHPLHPHRLLSQDRESLPPGSGLTPPQPQGVQRVMTLAIDLSDHQAQAQVQAQALAAAAARLQVSEAELVAAAVRDLIDRRDDDFAAAAQKSAPADEG